MPKKKASGGLAAGTRVRVKQGVASPEFDEICIEDWTGTIAELSGKSTSLKYIIEWDEETLAKMPDAYISKCEEQCLYYRMACLAADEVESADD